MAFGYKVQPDPCLILFLPRTWHVIPANPSRTVQSHSLQPHRNPGTLHSGTEQSFRTQPHLGQLQTGFCKQLSRPQGKLTQVGTEPCCVPGNQWALLCIGPSMPRQDMTQEGEGTGQTWGIWGPKRLRLHLLSFCSARSQAQALALRQRTARSQTAPPAGLSLGSKMDKAATVTKRGAFGMLWTWFKLPPSHLPAGRPQVSHALGLHVLAIQWEQ